MQYLCLPRLRQKSDVPPKRCFWFPNSLQFGNGLSQKAGSSRHTACLCGREQKPHLLSMTVVQMQQRYFDHGDVHPCAQDAVEQGWFLRGGAPDADPNMAAIKTAALQIATGMAYLHGRDLIHGNLNSGGFLILLPQFEAGPPDAKDNRSRARQHNGPCAFRVLHRVQWLKSNPQTLGVVSCVALCGLHC